MHVAGEIFRSAVVNTSSSVLAHVAKRVIHLLGNSSLRDLKAEFIKNQQNRNREVYYDTLDWGAINRASASDGEFADQIDIYLPLVILFQATRLAAMLHDIGHPPFSHIVEYALLHARGHEPDLMGDHGNERSHSQYLGHEAVGEILVERLVNCKTLRERSGFEESPKFADVCLDLCQKILRSTKKTEEFYTFKSSLVSGAVDADRLDYVRRDSYSAGMVPLYDIRPLIDGAFFRTTETGFEVGYRPNSLSALENFFQARNDLYRYMIYHHDVARRNLAVQRLLVRALDPGAQIPAEVADAAELFAVRAAGGADGTYETYESFEDSALMNFLWFADAHLPKPSTKNERALKIYLDVILRRRNDKLRSLIKRPDGYERFARRVCEELRARKPELLDSGKSDPVPLLNQLLRDRLDSIVNNDNGIDRKSKQNVAKISLSEAIEEKLDAAAISGVTQHQVKFKCYYFGTFSPGPNMDFSFSDPTEYGVSGEYILAESISPTIATLEAAWSNSPQISIFFQIPDGNSKIAASELRAIYFPHAVQGMVEFLVQPQISEGG